MPEFLTAAAGSLGICLAPYNTVSRIKTCLKKMLFLRSKTASVLLIWLWWLKFSKSFHSRHNGIPIPWTFSRILHLSSYMLTISSSWKSFWPDVFMACLLTSSINSNILSVRTLPIFYQIATSSWVLLTPLICCIFILSIEHCISMFLPYNKLFWLEWVKRAIIYSLPDIADCQFGPSSFGQLF